MIMTNSKVRRMNTAIAIMAVAILASCGGGSQDKQASTTENPNAGNNTSINQPAEQPVIAPLTTPEPVVTEPVATATPTVTAKLYKMNEVYRFVPLDERTTNKVVLLTFDDGPKDEAVLTSLLDTLDKHKAKAIFFVNGYRVKKNPDLLKLIHERGQTIGNHSWDHIDLKKEEVAKIDQQIGDLQKYIQAIIGDAPQFFRPPFGSGGDKVKEIAKKHGMLYMTWSNGSLDWEQKSPGKPDEVINNVLDQLHPGANILMHELSWTAEALDGLLNKLEEKGYGFIDPATIAVNP